MKKIGFTTRGEGCYTEDEDSDDPSSAVGFGINKNKSQSQYSFFYEKENYKPHFHRTPSLLKTSFQKSTKSDNLLEFSLKFQQKALIDPLRNALNMIKDSYPFPQRWRESRGFYTHIDSAYKLVNGLEKQLKSLAIENENLRKNNNNKVLDKEEISKQDKTNK